jgi:tetratricopeptide (TPR) repeat protein
MVHKKLAHLSKHEREVDAGYQHGERAVAFLKQYRAAQPEDPRGSYNLAICFLDAAELSLQRGDRGAAREQGRQALEWIQQAEEAKPKPPRRIDLALLRVRLGEISGELGDLQGASEHYRQALKPLAEWSQADPRNARATAYLVRLYIGRGDLSVSQGDYRAAREDFLKAREMSGRLPRLNRIAKVGSATVVMQLGRVHLSLGDFQAARAHFRQALEQGLSLQKAFPSDSRIQVVLALAHSGLGELDLHDGELPAASRHVDQALSLWAQLHAATPHLPTAQHNLAGGHQQCGEIRLQRLDIAGARRHYEHVLRLSEQAYEADPEDAVAQAQAAAGCLGLADVEYQARDLPAAIRLAQRSLEIFTSLEAAGHLRASFRQYPQRARDRLADYRLAERAVQDLDFALGQPAPQQAPLLLMRAADLARRGRHREAAATADTLAALVPPTPEQWYQAACAYALCIRAVAPAPTPGPVASGQPEWQGRYTRQALNALGRAIDLGYKNLAHLQSNPDLAVLRQHPDYLALTERLRK